MLEKPDLPDEHLIATLRGSYDLRIASVEFLPLGADVNTAVYRATDEDRGAFFVKLRRGDFDEATVLVPRLFADSGMEQVIAPIPTNTGDLWTRLKEYTVVLSPFVTGQDAFNRYLSESQWISLGVTLRQIHGTRLPDHLTGKLPRETFDPHYRELVRSFQSRVEHEKFHDPVAEELASLMRAHRDTISAVVARATRLSNELRTRSLEMVVCHGDIHAGNVLVVDQETCYIVDWDTLIMAPTERDLMFIGAGIGLVWNRPEEKALFYQGYGETAIDRDALAYFRYERIVQDIAEFCEQLLLTDEGGDDREQAIYYFASQFLPGSVVEMAIETDPGNA